MSRPEWLSVGGLMKRRAFVEWKLTRFVLLWLTYLLTTPRAARQIDTGSAYAEKEQRIFAWSGKWRVHCPDRRSNRDKDWVKKTVPIILQRNSGCAFDWIKACVGRWCRMRILMNEIYDKSMQSNNALNHEPVWLEEILLVLYTCWPDLTDWLATLRCLPLLQKNQIIVRIDGSN